MGDERLTLTDIQLLEMADCAFMGKPSDKPEDGDVLKWLAQCTSWDKQTMARELIESRAARENVKLLIASKDSGLEQLRARVAELEAENARLRVYDVRVVNGAIVGLDEILGED